MQRKWIQHSIGYKYGCTPGAYDNLVVSREDKERCKEIVATLVYKLIKSSKPLAPDELGVAIFYTRSISHSLSSKVIKSDGWIMTVMNRLMKYLTVIVRINADSRPKLVDTVTGVSYPIATFGDLREALQLMSMASSELRPYVAYMYNNVFLPYFNNPNRIKECEQNRPAELRTESGKSIMSVVEPNGISTKELADAIKTTMKLASRPSNDDVLKYYLYPLLYQEVINKEKNPYSLNENLWSPAETGNIFSMFSGDDIRLEIKDRVLYPDKISIEESFRTFVDFRYKQHGILEKNISDSDTANNPNPNTRYKLVDPEDNEISLDVLIERYLSNPESCFIQRNRLDLEWLSISGSEGLGISHTQDPEKYNFVSKYHPTCSGTLQQFSKNDIEENYVSLSKQYSNEGVKKSNLQNEPTSSTISESPSNSGRIYRLWVGGDEWGCSNCKIKGDRFEVDGHDCRK